MNTSNYDLPLIANLLTFWQLASALFTDTVRQTLTVWSQLQSVLLHAYSVCLETFNEVHAYSVRECASCNEVHTYSACVCASLTRWNEVCQTASFAFEELLHAWQHGSISKDKVTVCCNSKQLSIAIHGNPSQSYGASPAIV